MFKIGKKNCQHCSKTTAFNQKTEFIKFNITVMCPQIGPTFSLNFVISCVADFTLKRFVFENFYPRNTNTQNFQKIGDGPMFKTRFYVFLVSLVNF